MSCSPVGHVTFRAKGAHLSRRSYISHWRRVHGLAGEDASPAKDTASPSGDEDASLIFWICDTGHSGCNFTVYRLYIKRYF